MRTSGAGSRRVVAVGVVRVSKVGKRRNDVETGERFRSPEEQTAAMQELARRLGFYLPAANIFEDLNISGGTMDRPGLNEALERIRTGRASVLLVAYLDRFARTVVGGLEVHDRLVGWGGSLYAADFELDTRDPDGRMMLQIYLAIAERERAAKARRMVAAQVAATLEGIPISPLHPGYRRSKSRRVEVDPKREHLIEPLFERRRDGASLVALQSWWREETGETRKPSSFRKMLESRLYLGELTYGETVSPVRHRALVSPELWKDAQTVVESRPPRSRNPKALLAGRLVCSGCRRPMTPSTAGRDGAPVYKCQSSNRTWECPAPVTIRREATEAYVEERFLAKAGEIEAVTTGEDEADFAEADKRLEAAREASKRARRILLAADVDEEEAAEELAELSRKEEAAVAELEELHRTRKVAGLVWRIGERWGELDAEERHRLLSAGVRSVLVHPALVTEAGGRVRTPVAERLSIVWDPSLGGPADADGSGGEPLLDDGEPLPLEAG